ncbi:MAG TPA: hypothetical protein VJ992_03210 [Gemmatimonadales bacterium]|nr:hypothetical protein [Gemmatimonadales bacterium]
MSLVSFLERAAAHTGRSTLHRLATVVLTAVTAGACATAHPQLSTTAPSPDPRVGLEAGRMDAGEALWNLRLVSATPPSAQFLDQNNPESFEFVNSDLAFTGHYVVQGNFYGFQIWDIATPSAPQLVVGYVCPGSQNDVSVYGHLLFMSVESSAGRLDCGTQGVHDSVSADRMRGIRIFDLTDIAHPKQIADVQTCRGSHTHTVVTDPNDPDDIYIYVSGSAPVRSPNELAGCSALEPDQDPNSELFRIEVIKVPLAHPEQASVVSKPAILAGLTAPESHGATAADRAAATKLAAAARAKGAFTGMVRGMEVVIPDRYVTPMLDSIVTARGGTGAPTAADSGALRGAMQGILDAMFSPPTEANGVRPGPVQCHDITAYPAIGLAGGACAGYGLLLDIRDPANPARIGAVADSNFSFWHSATFSNDGTKLLFTDEWGGGIQPRCRASDPRDWGADAIFTLSGRTLAFQSYYKLPAPQTAEENCVAHNGSLIPVPGRDIMVQAWYQGGISVFDWTDPTHPKEIAFFDRGPMDSTKLIGAGSWSAYWYDGHIVSSEIARGLDILDLAPSGLLSQNEIDAAKLVRVDQANVQDQQKIVWPTSFVVARAYVDQLERSQGLSAARIAAVRSALAKAERMTGAAQRSALSALSAELKSDAASSSDRGKVITLMGEVDALAGAAS